MPFFPQNPEALSVEVSFRDGKIYLTREDRREIVRVYPPAMWVCLTPGVDWQRTSGPPNPFNLRWIDQHEALHRRRRKRPTSPVVAHGARARAIWAQAFREIPPEVLDTLKRFPPEEQWGLLNLCARSGPPIRGQNRALQLAQANPGTCIVVSSHWRWIRKAGARRRRWQIARSLLGKSYREILRLMGFPRSRSRASAKLLARLAPESCRMALLWKLRKVLRDDTVAKTLAHVPPTEPVIEIVTDPALQPCVTNSFLFELAEQRNHTARLLPARLRETLQQWEELTLQTRRGLSPQRKFPA